MPEGGPGYLDAPGVRHARVKTGPVHAVPFVAVEDVAPVCELGGRPGVEEPDPAGQLVELTRDQVAGIGVEREVELDLMLDELRQRQRRGAGGVEELSGGRLTRPLT